MNLLKSYEKTDPFGKSNHLAKFTIDTPLSPFTLRNVTQQNSLYTLSFWICSETESALLIEGETLPITTEWRRHSTTFLARLSDLDIYFQKTGTYYICYAKLEKGNKSTDYTPAPEDTEADIKDAAKTATNFMSFSSKGLIVGDMTKEVLGGNTLITSDGLKIRNGEVELASFSEKLIELGKNAAESVISLCGGAGTISSDIETYNDDSYNSLVISSDYVTKLKAGNGNAMVTASSNGFVKLFAASGADENDITLFTDHTYFHKKIELREKIVLYNNAPIKGTTTDGTELSLMTLGTTNNLIIGYGHHKNGLGITSLRGNDIEFQVKKFSSKYKPYYAPDDDMSSENNAITDDWRVNGFITTSKTQVCFSIALGKPVIGNPTIVVSSMSGLTVRQEGKWLYGSASGVYVEPESYKASLIGDNTIYVVATLPADDNVINNDVCTIRASLSIEFT